MIRIACIGECMVELSHTTETDLKLAFGGDTSNTAVYLARSTRREDVAVDYVTAIGDDSYSDAMAAFWAEEGIGTDLVARRPGRRPGLYTIRTDEQGERSFTYWRTASAARDMLQGDRLAMLAERLSTYDLVYLSGITLQIFDYTQRRALMRLCDKLREAGVKIAFDSNYRPAGWRDRDTAHSCIEAMLWRVDIALPTLDDEMALFEIADLDEAIQHHRRLKIDEFAIKMGASGCFVASEGLTGEIPGEPLDRVVDSTAAGDSFNAAYLAARLLGHEVKDAAQYAQNLAKRVISHRGAIIPIDDMKEWAGSIRPMS